MLKVYIFLTCTTDWPVLRFVRMDSRRWQPVPEVKNCQNMLKNSKFIIKLLLIRYISTQINSPNVFYFELFFANRLWLILRSTSHSGENVRSGVRIYTINYKRMKLHCWKNFMIARFRRSIYCRNRLYAFVMDFNSWWKVWNWFPEHYHVSWLRIFEIVTEILW